MYTMIGYCVSMDAVLNNVIRYSGSYMSKDNLIEVRITAKLSKTTRLVSFISLYFVKHKLTCHLQNYQISINKKDKHKTNTKIS